jgi:hypothetical protein
VWGILQCCHFVIYEEFLDPNLPVCWSFVVNEKPRISSLLARTFSSDRLPKVSKKAVYVHFFINGIISCKLCQRIPGKFWGYKNMKFVFVQIFPACFYFLRLLYKYALQYHVVTHSQLLTLS